MTDLLVRSTDATPAVDDRRGSLALAGVFAAAWTVVVGLTSVLVVVLVAWASDARSGAGAVAAVRTALQVWLAAQHVPLSVPGGAVSLAPLGLTAGVMLLLARAGRTLARDAGVDDLGGVARVAASVAVPYSVLTALVTAGAAGATVRPEPVLALGWSFAVALTAAALGAWRGTGLGSAPLRRLPGTAAGVLAGGVAGAALLVAAGGVLAAAALVAHAGHAGDALTLLRPGAVGGVALLLLQIGFVPNAVLWATAYLTGAGFAVGSQATVTPFDVGAARLPALPLLTAVPGGPAGTLVVAALVVGLLGAGAMAGIVVARRLGEASAPRRAGWGAAAGAAAAAVVALLVALSGGAAGPGALAAVGPSAWKVALYAAVELTPVSAAAAALTGARLLRP